MWFARDKGANYGFCEVASQEETERALQLDGMLVLGRHLNGPKWL